MEYRPRPFRENRIPITEVRAAEKPAKGSTAGAFAPLRRDAIGKFPPWRTAETLRESALNSPSLPETNIDFAPLSRQASFEPPKPDLHMNAPSPPDKSRSWNRNYAKPNPYSSALRSQLRTHTDKRPIVIQDARPQRTRRDDRVNPECTDPDCAVCPPTAIPARLARPRIEPIQSARDVDRLSADTRSLQSNPVTYYPSPPSSSQARRYRQESTIIQPAKARRSNPGAHRPRPAGYYPSPDPYYQWRPPTYYPWPVTYYPSPPSPSQARRPAAYRQESATIHQPAKASRRSVDSSNNEPIMASRGRKASSAGEENPMPSRPDAHLYMRSTISRDTTCGPQRPVFSTIKHNI